MNALRGLACLLLLQAAGEALTHVLRLPIPGPVVGLILLLPALRLETVRTAVAAAADLLLAHLSLLFVPVGVGVITHLELVSRYGVQLLAAIVASTWVGMVVTALVLRALLPRATSAPAAGATSASVLQPEPDSSLDSAPAPPPAAKPGASLREGGSDG